MLIEFSVENFLSIKDRVTLSMQASSDRELEDNTFKTNEYKLLKSAVILGANASGKTNVLRALEFMVDFILMAHRVQKGDEVAVTPFKLHLSNRNQPSSFEVVFLIDDVQYVYGFSVDSTKVHQEYLYSYKNDQEHVIFKRDNSNEYTFMDDHDEQEVLSKRTLENTLYLSVATQFNYKGTSNVFQWIKNTIKVETDTSLPEWRTSTVRMIENNPDSKKALVEILSNADTGIRDVQIPNKNRLKLKFENKIQDIFYQINTYHLAKDEDGNEGLVSFELKDESKGTQKMFDLLGTWFEVLQQGSILVMDELDTSLHSNLTTELVKLFHDPLRNPKNAQLIFTTHNTNLLDLDIFRRDQVWFTEKTSGQTELYSLYEFDEDDRDIERRYLVGRYGAVPTLRYGLFEVMDRENQITQEKSLQSQDDKKFTNGDEPDDQTEN